MRRKSDTEYIDVICDRCGNISFLQRTPTKRITMFTKTSCWCYKCKKTTTHYVLNDYDIAYRTLLSLEELNENQKRVLDIINCKNNNQSFKKDSKKKEKKLVMKNDKK